MLIPGVYNSDFIKSPVKVVDNYCYLIILFQQVFYNRKIMNPIKNSEHLIAQCMKKGGNIFLRPMFGDESILLHDDYINGMSDGDIIFISNKKTSDQFNNKIYKKDSIINRYFVYFERSGINPLFSREIMKEVEQIIASPGTDDPVLHDYTHLPFVTIDNDGSRDLDQAVYVEKTGPGYRIFYAIADASYYVKPGSALFSESIRRGASYYLPGFSVPMLPSELSEGIISLNEGVVRRSLIFIIEIDKAGNVVSEKIVRSRILSRAKLTYTGVQNFYDYRDESPLDNQEYTSSLICLQEAGRILARQAEERGVINFDRFENSISINGDGNSFIFTETERDDTGRWNEQISLLCNMAGAGMLAPEGNGNDLHIHPVFRVHEAPDESSLHRLEKVINSMVEIHSLHDCWIWRRGEETPGEYLSRLPRSGNERRITETIERQILITNQRSFFSENPGEHFALKVDLYGRFSSPMREIVGIYSHKELLEKLGVEKPSPDEDELLLREQVINSANRSKETQKSIDRFVNDLLLESVFRQELALELSHRPEHSGTLLGMKETKMYVLLDSPRLEIKVYNEDIEEISGLKITHYDNSMKFEGENYGMKEYKSGEIIRLKLLSFDDKGKWHFIPADI